MTLENGKKGEEYAVESLRLEGNIERRLGALGLTTGTKIAVLNNKKSGSVIFKVRGTRLAIGKEIAKDILIAEVK